MKMRIRGNTLRLRVTRSELQALASVGRIGEVISFGAGRALGYSLESDASVRTLHARYTADAITVGVSPALVRQWAETDLVTLEEHQPLDGDQTLRIVVEKDFACLVARAGEDDSDAFANPREGETC